MTKHQSYQYGYAGH